MNCSIFLRRCCAQLVGPAAWGWAQWMDNVPPCHLDPWPTPQGSCLHQRVVCPGPIWLLALDSWSACSNKKKKATWQHSSSVICFECGEEWGWDNFDFFFKDIRLPLDTGCDWCGLPVFSFLFFLLFSSFSPSFLGHVASGVAEDSLGWGDGGWSGLDDWGFEEGQGR